MADICSILTPIGEATLIGKQPDGERVLCMHTRYEQGNNGRRRQTFAKWRKWDGEKITEEYQVK